MYFILTALLNLLPLSTSVFTFVHINRFNNAIRLNVF